MKPLDLRPGEVHWIGKNIFARGTRGKGIRYGISFCHQGTRYRKIVGATVTEARKALAVTRSRIVRGRFDLADTEPSPLFEVLAQRYLVQSKATKVSWKHDKYFLNTLSAFFGGKRLGEITAWHVEQYKSRRREKVGPRSVNMELALLKRMFNLGIAWGLVDKNPVTSVKMFREDERAMRVLSLDEQTKLLMVCRQHLKDLILFALHTGMRRSEILGLKWTFVDMNQGIVTVMSTKTGHTRHVPANAVAMEVLKRRQLAERDYVFTWQGKRYSRFDKTWRAAVMVSGIAPIRFHDLRHTFATRLVTAGVDLVTVGELLGHRSIQMTLRYSHPGPEHRRRAVDHLAEVAPIRHLPKLRGGRKPR